MGLPFREKGWGTLVTPVGQLVRFLSSSSWYKALAIVSLTWEHCPEM